MPQIALLIARHWPEPASTAAGRRTLDLLSILSNNGYEIHLASAAEPTPFQADLTAVGYHCHSIRLNDSAFDDWLKGLNPALVVFDRFVVEEQFGWRVREHCPDSMTVLDTSDLHCLRAARELQVKKQVALNLNNETALREVASIVRCDLTLMISTVEIQILTEHFNIKPALLAYLPFLINPEDIQDGPSFSERQHVMMMGGFKHEPNRDATRWLREEIWPLLRTRLPAGTEMHVYGAYADHAMNQLHQPKIGFHIKGRADDALKTFGQYRLNLAPLRFGAGQKGKVLEGWLSGTPTLTNAIGIESMDGGCALGYPLPETAGEFADLSAQTYSDPTLWQQLVSNGHTILRERFLRTQHEPGVLTQIRSIQDNLAEHRTANFWGKMLWQQQYRAQEFMSRWIELKDQLKSRTADPDSSAR